MHSITEADECARTPIEAWENYQFMLDKYRAGEETMGVLDMYKWSYILTLRRV